MKKHVVVTLVVAMLLSVCGVCVAAGNDQSAKNLETRVIQLEADKQVNDARCEKDKDLKEIVKQQIQNSSQTISAVGTTANIVSGIIGVFAVIISIIGFFGFKSFNEIRKNLKEEYDGIVTKRKDVDDALKKIVDRQLEIEKILRKSKDAYAIVNNQASKILEMASNDNSLQPILNSGTSKNISTLKKITEFYKQGEYKKVVAIAETVQPDDKFYVRVCIIWGAALSLLGNYKEAIEKLVVAIKTEPQNSLAHTILGAIKEELGDMEGAINEYSETLKYDAENAPAYFYRAGVFARIKDARTYQDLKAAIHFDPKYISKAKTEPNFDSIRKDERYLKLVGV
jgi:tetratricopeptide (TPR) repeat protein